MTVVRGKSYPMMASMTCIDADTLSSKHLRHQFMKRCLYYHHEIFVQQVKIFSCIFALKFTKKNGVLASYPFFYLCFDTFLIVRMFLDFTNPSGFMMLLTSFFPLKCYLVNSSVSFIAPSHMSSSILSLDTPCCRRAAICCFFAFGNHMCCSCLSCP